LAGARRLGGGAQGLEPWAVTPLEAPGRPAIEITATPCRHGPPLSRPLAGDVIGFALRWEGQEHGQLWISGDTVLYDGVREVAGRIQVDIALLHLGGVQFPVTGPVRYSMTAKDAVELCGLVRPRTAIPIHYEGWRHFRQGREAIEREFAKAPEDIRGRVRWLPIGVEVEGSLMPAPEHVDHAGTVRSLSAAEDEGLRQRARPTAPPTGDAARAWRSHL
jgi:L-ascorbate metabolism protein UlaG (beta-lactamase superfamily)